MPKAVLLREEGGKPMYDYAEFTRAALQHSLAAANFWLGVTDIWGAMLGIKPSPKLLGFTVEYNGTSKVIWPNVRGWNHLTFKSRE